MFTNIILTTLTSALVLVAVPSVASAKGKGHRHDVCEAVTCTASQAEQIATLRAAKKAATKPIREQSKAVRAELHAETAKPKQDAAKIEKLRAELQSLRAQAQVHREAYVAKLKEVLTPQQVAKLEQSKRERKHGAHGKGGKGHGKGGAHGKGDDHGKGGKGHGKGGQGKAKGKHDA